MGDELLYIRRGRGSGSSSSSYPSYVTLADPLTPDAAIGKYAGTRTFSDSSGVMKLKDGVGYYSLSAEASTLAYPVSGNISATAGTISFTFTPTASTSGTVYLFGSTVDANNGTYLLHDGTNLIFRKRIAGVNYDTSRALAYVTGVTYEISFSWGSSGTRLRINGQSSAKNANALPLQLATTIQIAADGAAGNQPNGYIKLLNEYSFDFSGGKTTGRTVCSNRNRMAYTNNLTTTREKTVRVRKHIAKNANWNGLVLEWANIQAGSTSENNGTLPSKVIKAASIKYNGVFYPITFNGATYKLVKNLETVACDVIAGIPANLKDVDIEECLWTSLPLLYKTQTGNFTVGQTITGATSGATGVILEDVDGGTTGALALITETGTFQNNEIITDPLGGSATVDLTTSQRDIVAMGTLNIWIEGALGGNFSAVNGYTASDPTTQPSFTAIVNGSGNITGATKNTGGLNFTSGPNLVAWEVGPDGILYIKTIGYGNLGAGGSISSVGITSGTPPSGLARWTNPQLAFTAGGGFGSSTSVWHSSICTGIPDVPVSSEATFGDSKPAGFSSTDANGDVGHNYGYVERAIANRCGVLNLGISSLLASAMASHNTNYPKTWEFFANRTTHSKIDVGINDITTGATYAATKTNMVSIATDLRANGQLVSFSTLMPGTTSSNSFADEAGQTVRTGCGAGGPLDLINQDILSGAIVSDYPVSDVYSLLVGNTAFKWRTVSSTPPVAANLTPEGLHLSAYYGLVTVGNNAAIQASFNTLQ